MDREQRLALLADTHSFPGSYMLRVIVRPGGQTTLVTAIQAWCTEDNEIEHVEENPSAQGNWISVRVRIRVTAPQDILAVYEVIAQIDAVVMTL